MREFCKSGSVGGPGGQPPGSTRHRRWHLYGQLNFEKAHVVPIRDTLRTLHLWGDYGATLRPDTSLGAGVTDRIRHSSEPRMDVVAEKTRFDR